MRDNHDYTAVINERQHARLQRYLDDALSKGAIAVPINPANESFDGTLKMPMTLLLKVTDEMLVMQEEVFGPLLPIVPYTNMEEAIHYINARPRPLALYYFDWDSARANEILEHTHSGGVSINDTMSQGNADDIPFGGIGASGMGHYHGHEGFVNFSKAKGVVRKGKINSADLIAPPWNNLVFKLLQKLLDVKFRRKA